jgi:hypothetical protein
MGLGMAKAKKKTAEDDDFQAYLAEILKSYEITPEKRAEAHARMKEQAERARAAGVYQRLIDVHEQRVHERAVAMRERKKK